MQNFERFVQEMAEVFWPEEVAQIREHNRILNEKLKNERERLNKQKNYVSKSKMSGSYRSKAAMVRSNSRMTIDRDPAIPGQASSSLFLTQNTGSLAQKSLASKKYKELAQSKVNVMEEVGEVDEKSIVESMGGYRYYCSLYDSPQSFTENLRLIEDDCLSYMKQINSLEEDIFATEKATQDMIQGFERESKSVKESLGELLSAKQSLDSQLDIRLGQVQQSHKPKAAEADLSETDKKQLFEQIYRIALDMQIVSSKDQKQATLADALEQLKNLTYFSQQISQDYIKFKEGDRKEFEKAGREYAKLKRDRLKEMQLQQSAETRQIKEAKSAERALYIKKTTKGRRDQVRVWDNSMNNSQDSADGQQRSAREANDLMIQSYFKTTE